VVVLLLAIRFLNLILWWNVTRLELTHDHDPLAKARVGDYRFQGLSGYEAARKKMMDAVALQRVREVTVISYFDFLHPAIFLIHSRSSNPYVNLGRMSVYPDKGYTALYFHLSEILGNPTKGKPAHTPLILGRSLFPVLYETLAGTISGSRIGERTSSKRAGYIFYIRTPGGNGLFKNSLLPLFLSLFVGDTHIKRSLWKYVLYFLLLLPGTLFIV